MKLELRRAVGGTHFVICVMSDVLGKQIVVPLSPELSSKIQEMTDREGLTAPRVILPPQMRARN